MKYIIFSLAMLAMACTPESEDSEGETSSTAGTAVVGRGGQSNTAGVVAPRGGDVATNGAGQASVAAGDCRNAAMACSPGFECRLNGDGGYECLPPEPQAGEPAQRMAGEMVSGGQPAAGAIVSGMSAAAGEAMAGGQSMAGAPSAGQPMAGAPAPEACYGVRPIEVRPGNPMPGAIAAAFEVSTCVNEPAPNLVETDFALFENGEPIDAVEASRTILDRKAAAFVTIVLDNSPSVAAANAVDAVADAALAYVNTALTDTEQVYVSVASFSRRFTVLAPYSNDLDALRASIETYRADGSGSNTTNLYGSYIEALTASTTAQADYRSRNRDGLVTFGEVLFLTDGNDNAGVNDLAEAQAALSNTTDEVLVVGLGDVDANAVNALSTTAGVLAAADDVRGVFDARVTRILQRQQSIYVLGYCSPKLRGEHAVTVAIGGAPGVELLNFNADGWLDYAGVECSRAAFTDGCTDAACGGLWCGGCGSPDGIFSCDISLTCACVDRRFGGVECNQDDFNHVSAGYGHACGLRGDNTIVCWGSNSDGQRNVPQGQFRQVSAGYYHTCGLRDDNTIVCWGSNSDGQTDVPIGEFRQVSAGGSHACGLRDDNTVTCWGANVWGQTNAPQGQFRQVSAGNAHTCGLRTDNTITCWGYNGDGQTNAPEGEFSQVSAAQFHTCAVRTDNTITCWGNNDWGQIDAPQGQFSQVSTGQFHTCAVRTDNTITCWGIPFSGQLNVP